MARELGARKVIAVDVAVHMDKPRPAGAERYLEGDRAKREQIDAEARLADLVLHPYFGYWVNLSRDVPRDAPRARPTSRRCSRPRRCVRWPPGATSA